MFVPQITLLFLFLLILEDSGYLPRAAFLLDNLLSKVGLSGRSFIPLLSGFALRCQRLCRPVLFPIIKNVLWRLRYYPR
ncbi:nucleoside recognition domain-containing protein [Psychrobacter faecalis]